MRCEDCGLQNNRYSAQDRLVKTSGGERLSTMEANITDAFVEAGRLGDALQNQANMSSSCTIVGLRLHKCRRSSWNEKSRLCRSICSFLGHKTCRCRLTDTATKIPDQCPIQKAVTSQFVYKRLLGVLVTDGAAG